MPEPVKGLYSKYAVRDASGSSLNSGCFVMRPFNADGTVRDKAAVAALETYAETIGGEAASAIREWLADPVGNPATIELNRPS